MVSLEFEDPQKHGSGYFARVTNDGQKVHFTLKKCTINDPLEASTDIAITPSTEAVELFEAIDSEIVDAAKANKKSWFGRELANSTIEKAFKPSVSEDGVIGRLVQVGGKCRAKYFKGKEAHDLSEFEAPGLADIIMELAGVWFLQKQYWPVWRIVQVRHVPKKKPVYQEDCMFDSDEEDPQEREELDDLFSQ